MSSFSEKSVAAGTEAQDSLAQKEMQSGYGTGGGPGDGASGVHATTVLQPEGVLLTNPSVNDQNGHAPLLSEPVVGPSLEVVPEVVDVSAAVTVQATSEVGVMNASAPVAVVVDVPALASSEVEVMNASEMNNDNNISNEVVNKVLPKENENGSAVKDENNNNEVVTPNVNGNGGRSNEVVVTPSVIGNLNNNEVVAPSVAGNLNSNEVVAPGGGVDYQNNGIGNNAVATVNSGAGEASKRKRGRPRKYPIGEASTGSVVSSQSMAMQPGGPALVNAQEQGGSSEKRGRGRPAGSGKKHKADAAFPFAVPPNAGSGGAGFMPYIITVRSGEYVQPKVLSLSQADKQVVCVLSARGTISNVTLRQPTSSGGTVTYQGHFEILSLSGSFLLSESGGRRSITGGLSVSLAVPNGCIFGGCVAGPLIADSDVQIIAGTFLASEQNLTGAGYTNVLIPPNHVSSVGGSPPPRALLSESSGVSRSPFNHINGGCNNGNQQTVSSVPWM